MVKKFFHARARPRALARYRASLARRAPTRRAPAVPRPRRRAPRRPRRRTIIGASRMRRRGRHGMRRMRRRGARRNGGMKSQDISMTVTQLTRDVPPGFAVGGIDVSTFVLNPNPQGNMSAAGTITCQAEMCQTSQLGIYSFDFTRSAITCFGASSHALMKYFEWIKIGIGHLTIRRIDTGSNVIGYLDTTAGTTGGIHYANNGAKPTMLRFHYIRIRPAEDASMFQSIQDFLEDPRKRVRTIMPGRQMRLSFRLESHSYDHIENVYRIQNGAGVEQNNAYDTVLPRRARRVRRLPMSIMTQLTAGGGSLIASTSTPGIGPTINRMVSRNIVYMWESDQIGSYNTNFGGHTLLTAPVYPPLIFRREACSFTFSGMRMSQTGQVGAMRIQTTYPTTDTIASISAYAPPGGVGHAIANVSNPYSSATIQDISIVPALQAAAEYTLPT